MSRAGKDSAAKKEYICNLIFLLIVVGDCFGIVFRKKVCNLRVESTDWLKGPEILKQRKKIEQMKEQRQRG